MLDYTKIHTQTGVAYLHKHHRFSHSQRHTDTQMILAGSNKYCVM